MKKLTRILMASLLGVLCVWGLAAEPQEPDRRGFDRPRGRFAWEELNLSGTVDYTLGAVYLVEGANRWFLVFPPGSRSLPDVSEGQRITVEGLTARPPAPREAVDARNPPPVPSGGETPGRGDPPRFLLVRQLGVNGEDYPLAWGEFRERREESRRDYRERRNPGPARRVSRNCRGCGDGYDRRPPGEFPGRGSN
jgi:hypothetical protein